MFEKTIAKEEQDRFQRRIQCLLNYPENRLCVDCSRPRPRWATLIVAPSLYESDSDNRSGQTSGISLGSFCCLECSGAHRKLGTHITFVRSVDLDSFKEHEVQALESAGNSVVNLIYEARLFATSARDSEIAISFTSGIKPHATSDQNSREQFIRNKYEKKRYFDIDAFRQYHPIERADTSQSSSALSASDNSDTISLPDHDNAVTYPIKLQAFTTSPRTLAMLEKYMHIKQKKKRKRIRIISRRSLIFNKNESNSSGVAQESEEEMAFQSTRIPDFVTPKLNIIKMGPQTLTHQDEAEEFISRNIQGDHQSECDENISVISSSNGTITSTHSSMSSVIRRTWVNATKRLHLRLYRQNKKKDQTKKDKVDTIGQDDPEEKIVIFDLDNYSSSDESEFGMMGGKTDPKSPLLPPTSFHKKGTENDEEVEVVFQPCTPSNDQGGGDSVAATHFFRAQTIIEEDEEIMSPDSFTQISTTNQEEEQDNDEISNFTSGSNHGFTKKNFFKRFKFLPRSRTDHSLLTSSSEMGESHGQNSQNN